MLHSVTLLTMSVVDGWSLIRKKILRNAGAVKHYFIQKMGAGMDDLMCELFFMPL